MQNLNKQMRAFYAWQEQHSLSTVAIALYYTLLNHAGKCNSMEFSVAISTLSKHTGMSERSVFRARDLLSENNLIHIEQTVYRDYARYTIHSLPSSDSYTKGEGGGKFLGSFQNIIAPQVFYTHVQNWRI